MPGYSLSDDEKVISEIKISKAAIVFDWVSIPALLLIVFLTAVLPPLVSAYVNAEARALVMEALGVENINFSDVLANAGLIIMPGIPEFLRFACGFFICLLVICWFIWACFKTATHFGYELVLTDKRVIACAKGKTLFSEWGKVKNVFVARSIWGKLFGYGTVTVHAGSGSATVKYVSSPERVKKEFYSRLQDGIIN